MLHIIRVVSLILVIILIHKPAGPLPVLLVICLGPIIGLFFLSGISLLLLIKRNSIILIFAVSFFIFSLISQYISQVKIIYNPIITHVIRIITIFNIMTLGLHWLGKSGRIYIISKIPSNHIKTFLLLLYHRLTNFFMNQKNIIFQIYSRIDMRSRKRYRIPRYYVLNMLNTELYSIHNFHAAMIMRLPDKFPAFSYTKHYTGDYISTAFFLGCTIFAICLTFTGII